MKPFWYANLTGQTELEDEDGNLTGEYAPEYTEPVCMLGNISADRGDTSMNPFGIGDNYQRILQLPDPDAPLSELSVLWVDKNPYNDIGELQPHDYVVRGVARSLESSRFALRSVDVSIGDD